MFTLSVYQLSRYDCPRLKNILKDEDFPEGSVKLARNYCRNPALIAGAGGGPWCMTESILCGVPEYTPCNITVCDGKDAEKVYLNACRSLCSIGSS